MPINSGIAPKIEAAEESGGESESNHSRGFISPKNIGIERTIDSKEDPKQS